MNKTAVITGAARRIGKAIARLLHSQQWNIVIHYHQSEQEAYELFNEFNNIRSDSAFLHRAQLNDVKEIKNFANIVNQKWGNISALINNASSFYPTPLTEANEEQWFDLMSSNLKAPFFLSQQFSHALREQQGNIINIIDIHALKPKMNYSIYCTAKAGLWFMTKALAQELAPEIRVNGVAPGAILWAEGINTPNEEQKSKTLNQIPLHRSGEPNDIAETVLFLINQHYITGQIIPVDGGRSING